MVDKPNDGLCFFDIATQNRKYRLKNTGIDSADQRFTGKKDRNHQYRENAHFPDNRIFHDRYVPETIDSHMVEF